MVRSDVYSEKRRRVLSLSRVAGRFCRIAFPWGAARGAGVELMRAHPRIAGGANSMAARPDDGVVGADGLQANATIAHERHVPPDWSAEQRREMLRIASRAKAELCASFALVALGVQAFCFNSNTSFDNVSKN